MAVSTPCREWQGATNRGYGWRRDKEQGKSVLLHRWVVAQVHGWDAIKGKIVMHLCDNPLCYRYDHLQIGTNTDNRRDCVAKGRHRSRKDGTTKCPQGHQYDTTNTYWAPDGTRACRECRREAVRRYRSKRHAHQHR